ncbi:MAG TPA: YdcF family protein [Bryobacterales bacterium]|nr:YdcF family protein [Bryobacterales bacterium]
MRKIAVIAVLCAGALAAACFVHVCLQVARQAGRNEAGPADAIVVFGAAEYRGHPSPVLKARLDHALDLYRRGLAPRIITTGGRGGDPRFSEGEVGRSYLAKNNVPAEMILVENEGETTMESAAAVAEIMDRVHMSSCIVVSDGYHLYRVKKMLESRGIRALGSPRSAGPEPALRRDWQYARQALGYMLWRMGIRI